MSKEAGYEKMRFENQEDLGRLAGDLLRKLDGITDAKFASLLEILSKHSGEKIVIFCIYRETARQLTKLLSAQCSDRIVKTTVDIEADELETILDFFAPVANGRLSPEEPDSEFSVRMLANRVDILVASEAISEGFNLQDSRILVNYDLPWSVLQLAQRMGRLMRPWHEPRDLIIFNFLPDTMSDTELKHGRTWRERLDHRSKEHQSFASLPVMLQGASEEVSLFSLSSALQQFDSADLELNEAMDFIGSATQIETSSVLDDLAQISTENFDRIRRIRSGFRSRIRRNAGDPALFLLITLRSSVFPAVFDENCEFFLPPYEVSRPLEILRYRRADSIFQDDFDPNVMDDFQERCLKVWLSSFSEQREKVRTICALHFSK